VQGTPERYWPTTLRTDGRPHVIPPTRVAKQGCISAPGSASRGPDNLEYQREVVLSTATPALAVSTSSVEGTVVRVVD
jgi:hypothetical protein